MKAKDIIMGIREEAEIRARNLAQDTEGHFKPGDMGVIYEDADMAIFKAGIREVVDYFFYEAGIVALMGCATMEECKAKLPNWQSKIKEWMEEG